MLEQEDKVNLVKGIRRFLTGQRSFEVLCDELDRDEAMIMEAILRCSTDQSYFEYLLPQQEHQGNRVLLTPGFHWGLKMIRVINSLRKIF
jgi:hypothetical protein